MNILDLWEKCETRYGAIGSLSCAIGLIVFVAALLLAVFALVISLAAAGF